MVLRSKLPPAAVAKISLVGLKSMIGLSRLIEKRAKRYDGGPVAQQDRRRGQKNEEGNREAASVAAAVARPGAVASSKMS